MFYNSHALIFACCFRSIMSLPREAQAEAKRDRRGVSIWKGVNTVLRAP